MATEYQQHVVEYFRDKAADYDRTDDQPYWRLSDDVLWHALEQHVLPLLEPGFSMLDAGGGTGRWTDRFLRADSAARSLLFDLSESMSAQARAKADDRGYGDRLDVVNGDLADVTDLLDNRRFDLVTSFHNVLGFVTDPADVIAQLSRLLRPGGVVALVVPSVYHAAFFNLRMNDIDEATRCVDESRGRFTSDMPDMHLFTPAGLERTCETTALTPRLLTGFPNIIYPGYQETQLFGSTNELVELLDDQAAYNRIFQLEIGLLEEPGIAARGNNLLLVAQAR